MRSCHRCKPTFLSMMTCPRDEAALTVDGGDPLLGEVLPHPLGVSAVNRERT